MTIVTGIPWLSLGLGPITEMAPLTGGDTAKAWRLHLRGGRTVFAKCMRGEGAARVLQAEARGLHWLREARALRVPEVLHEPSTPLPGGVAALVLEWIEPGRPSAQSWQALGEGLAQLHAAGTQAAWGLSRDNFIGSLPQANFACASWAEFFGEARLRPQLQRACNSGSLPQPTAQSIEALIRRLPDCLPEPLPARLHGDLWRGNLLFDQTGAPVLIDPAVYLGDGEVDVAMMDLFGGFSERTFDAYASQRPLPPGWAERRAVYQLYPLLVHLNLFGRTYLDPIRTRLQRLASSAPMRRKYPGVW